MSLASKSDEGSRITVGQKEGRRKQTGRMSWGEWWGVVESGGDLVVQQVVMMTALGWERSRNTHTKRARDKVTCAAKTTGG